MADARGLAPQDDPEDRDREPVHDRRRAVQNRDILRLRTELSPRRPGGGKNRWPRIRDS